MNVNINLIDTEKHHRKRLGDIQALADSISKYGLLHPIIVTGSLELICGRRRLEACKLLEWKMIPCSFVDVGKDKLFMEADENAAREGLCPSDAVYLAEAIEAHQKALAKDRQREHAGTAPGKQKNTSAKFAEVLAGERESKVIAARAVGMSKTTLDKAQKVINAAHAKPQKYGDLVKMMDESGKIDGAHRELVRRIKREELSQRALENLDSLGKYSILYVDPPWTFEDATSPNRSAENQYPLMTLEEIKSLEVPAIAQDDSVLFLWCPSSKMGEADEVIRSWGFVYKTNFVWIKESIGLGHYNRQRHEFLMVATKGSPGTPDPKDRFDSVIKAARKRHSAKPEYVYEIIERMYPDRPKIELFARQARPGWKSWGYEAEKGE